MLRVRPSYQRFTSISPAGTSKLIRRCAPPEKPGTPTRKYRPAGSESPLMFSTRVCAMSSPDAIVSWGARSRYARWRPASACESEAGRRGKVTGATRSGIARRPYRTAPDAHGDGRVCPDGSNSHLILVGGMTRRSRSSWETLVRDDGASRPPRPWEPRRMRCRHSAFPAARSGS